jgi:hypothetical protein
MYCRAVPREEDRDAGQQRPHIEAFHQRQVRRRKAEQQANEAERATRQHQWELQEVAA